MDKATPDSNYRGITAAICAVLLISYMLISMFSWRDKGITPDEPVHFASAALIVHHGEFRLDTQSPPLWKYIAMLPNLGKDTHLDVAAVPALSGDRGKFYQWSADQLFKPGNTDDPAMLHRSRIMLLLVAGLLGAAIAYFAWRIAGQIATIIATILFCFDPNLLAHGFIFKNDVIEALWWVLMALAIWEVGRRATVLGVLAIGGACAAGILSKFPGVFMPPVIIGLFIYRAFQRRPWTALGRSAESLKSRSVVSAGVILAAALLVYCAIWACYQFRFAPAPEPGATLARAFDDDEGQIARSNHYYQTGELLVHAPPGYQKPPPPFDVKVFHWFDDHHLFPQAFIEGLLYTRASAGVWPNYLLGETRLWGWWYYFPFAILVKTPIATLLVILATGVIGLVAVRKTSPESRWTALCVLFPMLLFLGVAMTSNIDIGIRHIFPFYGLLYVALGWAGAWVWKRGKIAARIAVGVLLVGGAVESLAAYPNFIPFFNAVAVGHYGRANMLSDSNIDWGQDIPALAAWQREHNVPVIQYACFSVIDPAYYGLKYVNLPGGYGGTGSNWPPQPGIVAISVTNLQGVYRLLWPVPEDLYRQFREYDEPIDIINHSIYLYRINGTAPTTSPGPGG